MKMQELELFWINKINSFIEASKSENTFNSLSFFYGDSEENYTTNSINIVNYNNKHLYYTGNDDKKLTFKTNDLNKFKEYLINSIKSQESNFLFSGFKSSKSISIYSTNI